MEYQCQCQGIMAITFRFKLDFAVYVLKEIHVERIFFEKEKCDKEIVPKLTNFFLIIWRAKMQI